MARLVSFHDAALGYGNTPALTGLTLDVFGGQALALVGPNGGGKTTLMRGIVAAARSCPAALRSMQRASASCRRAPTWTLPSQ